MKCPLYIRPFGVWYNTSILTSLIGKFLVNVHYILYREHPKDYKKYNTKGSVRIKTFDKKHL